MIETTRKSQKQKTFETWAKVTQDIDEVWTIRCTLGLWSVSGRDYDRVLAEALHYFQQYWADGEYDGLKVGAK